MRNSRTQRLIHSVGRQPGHDQVDGESLFLQGCATAPRAVDERQNGFVASVLGFRSRLPFSRPRGARTGSRPRRW
jgi:hypothetical protein